MVHVIDDVMRYYHLNFISVYCLAGVIMLSTVACFFDKNNKLLLLLYSLIAEVGLVSSMYFTGVLQDNNAPDVRFWGNQLWILLFLSVVGCLIQLIQLIRKNKKSNKKRNT